MLCVSLLQLVCVSVHHWCSLHISISYIFSVASICILFAIYYVIYLLCLTPHLFSPCSWQAFAIFCGLGIHNSQMYEKALKLAAKQKVALEVLSFHASSSLDECNKLMVKERGVRVPKAAGHRIVVVCQTTVDWVIIWCITLLTSESISCYWCSSNMQSRLHQKWKEAELLL